MRLTDEQLIVYTPESDTYQILTDWIIYKQYIASIYEYNLLTLCQVKIFKISHVRIGSLYVYLFR